MSNSREWSSTLISLCPPAIPKKECHIHGSLDATASRINEGVWLRPLWEPCQPTGQFFQSQCMQSNEPNIPGNPRASPCWSSRAVSAAFGDRKYCSSNNPITVVQNSLRVSIEVERPILMYSSVISAEQPYAKMRTAAVTFCNGDNPGRPHASGLWTKYVFAFSTAVVIRRNNSRRIRKRRRKNSAG